MGRTKSNIRIEKSVRRERGVREQLQQLDQPHSWHFLLACGPPEQDRR